MNRLLIVALPFVIIASVFACAPEPAGSFDGGSSDLHGAEPDDGVVADGGAHDAGAVDAGDVDAGDVDAGEPDAGVADAGPCPGGMPTAVLRGPNGEENGLTTTVDAGTIELDGTQSCGAVKWAFYLVKKPAGALAMLEGNGVPSTNPTALLTIDPARTGLYRVTLVVKDANDQSSAGADLDIIVNP